MKEIDGLEELKAETTDEFEASVFSLLEEEDMIESHRKIISSSIESVPYTALEYEIELDGEKKHLSILYQELTNQIKVDDYSIGKKK